MNSEGVVKLSSGLDIANQVRLYLKSISIIFIWRTRFKSSSKVTAFEIFQSTFSIRTCTVQYFKGPVLYKCIEVT